MAYFQFLILGYHPITVFGAKTLFTFNSSFQDTCENLLIRDKVAQAFQFLILGYPSPLRPHYPPRLLSIPHFRILVFVCVCVYKCAINAFNSSFQDTRRSLPRVTVQFNFQFLILGYRASTCQHPPQAFCSFNSSFQDTKKLGIQTKYTKGFQFLILGYPPVCRRTVSRLGCLSIPHFRILVKVVLRRRFAIHLSFNSSFQDTTTSPRQEPPRLPKLSIPHFRIRV